MTQLASGTLSATNATSPYFSVSAGTFSVQIKGATPSNPVELLRSLDAGATGAPVGLGANLAPAVFTYDISVDVTESRSGAQYAVTSPNPGPAQPYQAWQ